MRRKLAVQSDGYSNVHCIVLIRGDDTGLVAELRCTESYMLHGRQDDALCTRTAGALTLVLDGCNG